MYLIDFNNFIEIKNTPTVGKMKWGLVTLDGPSKSPQRGDLIQAKALKPPLGVWGPSFLLCPKQTIKKVLETGVRKSGR